MTIRGHIERYKWVILIGAGLVAAGAVTLLVLKKYSDTVPFLMPAKQYVHIPKESIKKIILDNGMTVLLYQNRHAPKVLVQIAYDIGSAVEQSGEKGYAHLVEHMIFKGTQTLSEGDIDAIARKYGASFNAFTSHDVTSYYFEVDRNNWKPFVPILADCMVNARFDEQHLASELKTVVQELRMRKDKYWGMMVEKAAELLFAPNHPYHFPIIGFKDDIASVTSEKLRRFYKKYYHPSHATLFVVGDIDPREVEALAKKHFEGIPSPESKAFEHFPGRIDDTIVNTTRMYREVNSEQLGFYFAIPGQKDQSYLAIEATASLLGWGENSRLNRRLVDEEKVATSVSVQIDGMHESSIFLILVCPKEGKSAECRRFVEEELEALIDIGATRQELNKIAKSKKRTFFQKTEDLSNFTYDWINTYFARRDEFHIFEKVNALYDLTSRDISEFAKRYLNPFMMSEIAVLPIPEIHTSILRTATEKEDVLEKKILESHIRTTPKEKPKLAPTLPASTPIHFSFPKPDRELTLPNGLKVILTEAHHLPFLTVKVQFRDAHYLGSAKEGVLVDAMMDMLREGSVGYTKKQSAALFENEGAAVSFSTHGASLTTLNESIDKVLPHFAHVLTRPAFQQDALEKTKEIGIDQYERQKNNPQAVAFRILKNVTYPEHSFAWSFEDAIGMLHDLNVQDLDTYHRTYVTPSSMVVSVVGDFELGAMQKKIESAFTSWQGQTYTKPIRPKASLDIKPKQIDYYMLRDQAILLLGQPSPIDIYHADLIPLKLLNFVCWHSLGSRLYQLREETGLFYKAFGAWGKDAGRVPGYDFLCAIVSPESVEGAEKKIRKIVDEIAESGITKEELDVARQLYLKELIDRTESNSGLSSTFASLEGFNLGFDYYDKMRKRVLSITVKEVNAIAKQYFNTKRMNRIRIGRVTSRRR